MQPQNYESSSSFQQNSQRSYIQTSSNLYQLQHQYYVETQSEINDVSQINFEEAQTPAQQRPKFMYKYYFDRNTGQRKWNLNFMFPGYYKYFKGLQKTLMELAETINKKWTEEQRVAYITYLTDVNNYIRDYIWTKYICDFNMFQQAMTQYSEETNPLGAEIYNSQLQYLHKKSIGYDFFQDKKKKKQQKKLQEQKQQTLIRPQHAITRETKQKKQEEIIRSPDPIINFNELLTRKWPQDKYTNLELFKKENANLVFIGHVDSGKSTLTGNILKELNEVDEQEWARNKQQAKDNHMESWELAGIADVDPTQRMKGITIEYAKLIFAYEIRRFTLFDAPGHKNFVPNMIMGACQADIAVLIISAKSGEFQSGFVKEGQTREHALLAKSLGVTSIVVAVTKMSTVDWAEERFNEIKTLVLPFLKDTCGYNQCQFIPVDSISNMNIHKHLENSWYKGDFLLKALQNIPLLQRNVKGPLRLPIIDKFKEVGNLYIYGKLQSGILTQNQTVTILPQRKEFVVRQIFNAKDEKLPYAIAGENVKLRIKGLQEDEIKRGNIVCNNMNYCLESQEFKAVITVVELPQQKKLLSNGYEGIIHIHAVSENIQIIKVESKINKEKKTIPASYLLPGETGNVVIKVENPICLEKFEFMPNLGRFTLRDEGKYDFVIFQDDRLWSSNENKARQNFDEGAKVTIRVEKRREGDYKLTWLPILRDHIHNDKYYYYPKKFSS